MIKWEATLMGKRLYIIEDDAMVQKALLALWEDSSWCVEAFFTAESFLSAERETGVILCDIRLKDGMSGLQFFDQLRLLKCSHPIIFLSGHGDIDMAVDVMQRGAYHFLTKPYKNQHLMDVVYAAHLKLENKSADLLSMQAIPNLTKREKGVLTLLIKGLSSKAIAQQLTISIHTVDVHRANILNKTAMGTTKKLMAHALQNQWDKALA
jgi:FixJ family two-component response regulator